MVTHRRRLLEIGLAAGTVPLAASSCELLAGVHDVTLLETARSDAGTPVRTDAGSCGVHTGTTFYVDPLDGDDRMANGSMEAPCSFQTITAALQQIGATPATGTTVVVLNTASVVSPPETFPIEVPANVTIQGQPTVVRAPTGVSAVFRLQAPASELDKLVIDGTQVIDGVLSVSDVATGIEVDQGSDVTTRITNVQVGNMHSQGIAVYAGAMLTLGSGVSSISNGPPLTSPSGSWPGDGLVVYGTVTIHVDAGETAAEFNDNKHFGIWVRDSGSLTVTGTANPVVIATRDYHGLTITQTPVPYPPLNAVASLIASDSVGHGIVVNAGSSLKLRGSETRSSYGYGIVIETAAALESSDVTWIDLGTESDPGGNTFQFAPSSSINVGSGICLILQDLNAGQTLHAAGNIFGGTDCASTPASLNHIGTCAFGTDYGILVPSSDAGIPLTTNNTIDLSKCM
jgi:hypothetical protein